MSNVHLQSHLILSWTVGHRRQERRDRVIVTWAGVAPDLDAASALLGNEAYSQYHHVLSHNVLAAAAVALLAAAAARDRVGTALWALAAFHLHLATDLLGSGVAWSIAYLYPFGDQHLITPYGWDLASWQNIVITLCAILFSVYTALTLRRTFVESFLPKRADQVVVAVIRRRLGRAP